MNNKDIRTCYICGNPKESREHVPAKCFFPEDHRNNLITVPSCKEHNEDTSEYDNYSLFIISMNIGNNQLAENKFLTSCLNALKRDEMLYRKILGKGTEVCYGGVKTKAFEIDREQIDFTMRKIAYGLYFNEYGKPWNRELVIMTENLKDKNLQVSGKDTVIQDNFKNGLENKLSALKYKGNNPEIFQFGFLGDENNMYDMILVMKFYENFEIYAMALPNTNGPKLKMGLS
jgi:hypothetical protein